MACAKSLWGEAIGDGGLSFACNGNEPSTTSIGTDSAVEVAPPLDTTSPIPELQSLYDEALEALQNSIFGLNTAMSAKVVADAVPGQAHSLKPEPVQ